MESTSWTTLERGAGWEMVGSWRAGRRNVGERGFGEQRDVGGRCSCHCCEQPVVWPVTHWSCVGRRIRPAHRYSKPTTFAAITPIVVIPLMTDGVALLTVWRPLRP